MLYRPLMVEMRLIGITEKLWSASIQTASGPSYSLSSYGLTGTWKALKVDIVDLCDEGICSVKPTNLSERYTVEAS